MLTHARIFEMNISICRILQSRLLPVSSETVYKALEARIELFVQLLGAIEKHGSCIIVADAERCGICERAFSETRDRGGEEEIVHCCLGRAHTQCLDVSAPGYSRTDMLSTCGRCSGAMTDEVVKRVEKYANMCVQTESRGPFDEIDWVARLQGTDMDLSMLTSSG